MALLLEMDEDQQADAQLAVEASKTCCLVRMGRIVWGVFFSGKAQPVAAAPHEHQQEQIAEALISGPAAAEGEEKQEQEQEDNAAPASEGSTKDGATIEDMVELAEKDHEETAAPSEGSAMKAALVEDVVAMVTKVKRRKRRGGQGRKGVEDAKRCPKWQSSTSIGPVRPGPLVAQAAPFTYPSWGAAKDGKTRRPLPPSPVALHTDPTMAYPGLLTGPTPMWSPFHPEPITFTPRGMMRGMAPAQASPAMFPMPGVTKDLVGCKAAMWSRTTFPMGLPKDVAGGRASRWSSSHPAPNMFLMGGLPKVAGGEALMWPTVPSTLLPPPPIFPPTGRVPGLSVDLLAPLPWATEISSGRSAPAPSSKKAQAWCPKPR